MPVLVVSEVPGGSKDRDDAAVAALELETNAPPGARFRVAGPTESGWRVLSLWDSEEQFDEFLESRLRPALERVGMPEPSFERWPIESVIVR